MWSVSRVIEHILERNNYQSLFSETKSWVARDFGKLTGLHTFLAHQDSITDPIKTFDCTEKV